MGGGGGGGGSYPMVQQPTVTPPQITPTGGGPTPVDQTFTQQGYPYWGTGLWGMPWWGMSAATGQPLTPADLQAPATPAAQQQQPAAPQQQEAPFDSVGAYRAWRQGQIASGKWGEYGDNNTYQDFLLDPASRFAESGMGMPGMAGVIWSMRNHPRIRR